MLCLKINGFGGFKVANKISFFMKTLFILFEMVILHGGLHSLFTISLIIIDNYLGVNDAYLRQLKNKFTKKYLVCKACAL